MSISGRMDKQNLICTCDGVLFNLKKEGNSHICHNMGEHCSHYANRNKPASKGHILYDFTLHEAPRIVKFIETVE